METISSNYAKLSDSNTFTGNNTFKEVSATSYTGNGVTTSYASNMWGTDGGNIADTVTTVGAVIGYFNNILASSNTFTGDTNTFKGVSATSYTGTGIYNSTTAWSSSTNDNAKLPTVGAVKKALSGYAKLGSSNTFTGDTNTFKAISTTTTTATTSISSPSYIGDGVCTNYDSWANANDQIPTAGVIKSVIKGASDYSDTQTVGAIGLFLYTKVGDEAAIGTTVNGSDLKPVGISLPLSGQISYKSTNTTINGTWRLMSVAFKRTTTAPCLVLAQRI